MFERNFQRAMTYGARLLFFVAALVVLLSIVNGVELVIQSARPSSGDRSTWMHHLGSFWSGLSIAWPHLLGYVMNGLSSASLPFFGALVVHRIDQWMASR